MVFGFLKARRRRALRAEPLPDAHRAILDANVAYARGLEPEARAELEGLVQVFLAEKRFEGCGGLELTDEIRVTIAAQACVLLLGREHDVFPELETVLVYPTAYRVPELRREGAVEVAGDGVRLGESWARGVIVLSWDHAKRGAGRGSDGKNVVLHEFAHQLDAEDGVMDGAPELEDRASYASWARVLGREYDELVRRLGEGRAAVIDGYGATSPCEFFAVVTEAFFEKPHALHRRHPELYAELAHFYNVDPAGALPARES